MRFLRHPFFTISLLILFTLNLTSCDSISDFFSSETPQESANEKSKSKTPKTTLKAPDKKESSDKKSSSAKKTNTADQVIIEANDRKQTPLKKINPDSQKRHKKIVQSAIMAKKQIGGTPYNLIVDKSYIYLEDAEYLNVYSRDFQFLDRIEKVFAIKDIVHVEQGEKNRLYVTQDEQVLEIFDIVKNEGKTSLQFVASFDVEGPFSWLDSETLLVFLKDALQVVDFSNLDAVKVKKEIPVGNITSKLILQKYLYLARDEFLDIVNLENFETTASLRIGQPYKFLGAIRKNETNTLNLALLNSDKKVTGIQTLTLAKNLSGITDLGSAHFFKKPLQDVSTDLKNNLLFAKDSQGKSKALVFSIDEKKFLRGPLDQQSAVIQTYAFEDLLFVIHNDEIAEYKLTLNPDVIKSPAEVSTNAPVEKPALAQIGSDITLKNEYNLEKTNRLDFANTAHQVFLLDQNHLVIVETQNDKQNMVTTQNLTADDHTLKTVDLPDAQNLSHFLSTPFGLLGLAQNGQVYFLDVFFKGFQKLDLNFKNLNSWIVFKQNDHFVLLAVTKQLSENKTEQWQLEFYKLLSPDNIESTKKLTLNSQSFLSYMGFDLLAVVSQNQIDYYSISDLSNPIKVDNKTQKLAVDGLLTQIKPTPKRDFLLTLQRKDQQNHLQVYDFKNPAKPFEIAISHLSPNQFNGISFTEGGRVLIIPTNDGLHFYDLSLAVLSTEQSKWLIGHWPEPSEFADVANKGQWTCVARGNRGTTCGDISLKR